MWTISINCIIRRHHLLIPFCFFKAGILRTKQERYQLKRGIAYSLSNQRSAVANASQLPALEWKNFGAHSILQKCALP